MTDRPIFFDIGLDVGQPGVSLARGPGQRGNMGFRFFQALGEFGNPIVDHRCQNVPIISPVIGLPRP